MCVLNTCVCVCVCVNVVCSHQKGVCVNVCAKHV